MHNPKACWFAPRSCRCPRGVLSPPFAPRPILTCSSRILWVTALTTAQTALTMLSMIIFSRTIRKLVRPTFFLYIVPIPHPLVAMFYIGSNTADWPLEAQRGLADGHEICVRMWPCFSSCFSTHPSPRHLVSPLQSVLFLLPSNPYSPSLQ